MAVLKFKDAKKMSANEKESKLKELRMALVRSYVGANKTNAKTKEIKRAISRLLTSQRNMKNTKNVNSEGKKDKFNKSSAGKAEMELKNK